MQKLEITGTILHVEYILKEVAVMAVPARKTSKTRKRLRRTHYKLQAASLSACPNCGELRRPHRVCPSCGYYDGKEVVKVK